MIDEVPPELRACLYHSAAANEISLNEQAVRILADHYRVKWQTPSNGLRGHDGPPKAKTVNAGSSKLSIRGGAKLHRKIAVDAARRGGTLRGVVLECLSLHYQLEPEPIGRRPRKKETTA